MKAKPRMEPAAPSEAGILWAQVAVNCAGIPSEPGEEGRDAAMVEAAQFILRAAERGAPPPEAP